MMGIILTVTMVSQVYTYVYMYYIAHFKHVQMIITQLYLDKALKKKLYVSYNCQHRPREK